MTIMDPFVLPADIVITPVKDLDPQVRVQFTCDDDDLAISRPHSRATTKIISPETAALVRCFADPHTIVEAVIGFSRTRQLDPEAMLVDAFPTLQHLIRSGLLLPHGEGSTERMKPSLAPSDVLDGCQVLTCVQMLEDTELYQARRDDEIVALKIARPSAGELTRQMIAHEAEILALLDGDGVPRLRAGNSDPERPYIAMTWCQGIPIADVANDLQRTKGGRARAYVAELCLALLDAYAGLHARGVIHADIHPHNVLVDGNGHITLIDFGLARADVAALREPPRAGVGFYFEPEFARAMQGDGDSTKATAAGEQYALAALVYQLLTGTMYLDFSLERDEMLRQIVEDPPRSFVQRGVVAWPEVETVVNRALSKAPRDRFPSVAEFAAALRAAVAASAGAAAGTARQTDNAAQVAPELLDHVLALVSPGGAWYEAGLSPPTASVTFGAAGIACALLRLACARSDPALLALADIWIGRAERAMTEPGPFFNAEAGLDPADIGAVSTFHTATGVDCVRAQIAATMGDLITHELAIASFLAGARMPCDVLDLMLGRSGLLLATADLLDTCLPVQEHAIGELHTFGNDELAELWAQLDTRPAMAASVTDSLGIAHGWGGMLYAGMRWCQAAELEIRPGMAQRLFELASLAEPYGRGLRWPWVRQQPGQPGVYMAGWCNGNAGYVHLWTLAHELTGDNRYAALAEQAGWGAWEQPSTTGNLCCGAAGQAYALLNLYFHTGEYDWLHRAHQLAARAAAEMDARLKQDNPTTSLDLRPESLYKGLSGVAALLGDLAQPAHACQPFFERAR